MAENWFDRLVGTVLRTMGIVLQRALLHMAAIGASFYLMDSFFHFGFLDALGVKLSIYAGIICLVPYGAVKNPYWFIPVAAGVVQGIVLAVPGIPLPFVLFWAGLQTWLVRLLAAKGSIGWDWTAAPVLIIGLFSLLSSFAAWGIPLWPLASVPVLAALGLAAYKLYLKAAHTSVHRQIVASLLVRLREIVRKGQLAESEERYTRLLLSQLEKLAVPSALDDETLVDRLNALAMRLERLGQNRVNKPLGTLFKSAQWQHLASTPTERDAERSVLEELKEVTAILAGLLQPRAPQDESRDNALLQLAEQARSLLDKQRSCPRELAGPLENIAFLSLDMVKAMRDNPGGARDAASFLARYLPRVHRVADETSRMRESASPGGISLERTREVLERLEGAFRDEKNRLSRNDSINYQAEIDALDSLLKMRGY